MIFAGVRKTGQVDLEAIEMLVRGSLHRAGAEILSRLLSQPCGETSQTPCACGQAAQYHDTRPKQLLTVLGPLEFQRGYYVCPTCRQGQSPRDRELDVEGVSCSPGVRRMMAVVGSDSSFQQGRQQLELLAGIEVTAKAVERQAEAVGGDVEAYQQSEIQRAKQLELPEVCAPAVPILYIEMDGTGVPVVQAETEGRAGKVEGQPAHTREVKLGCVFTQTTTDQHGRPVRDEDTTTYAGAIETAEEFGLRVYTEAWRRGWSRAQKKVVIGDGAIWIWNLAEQHFPGAIQIVDLYHARQHLWEVTRTLYPSDQAQQKAWMKVHQKRLLDKGKIAKLVGVLRSHRSRHPEVVLKIRSEADYFERNAHRMQYPKFRRQHLFVGSGVIEAGCKTVIAARLKRSGMFWTIRGANAILALRCSFLNARFEDYWADRRVAMAA